MATARLFSARSFRRLARCLGDGLYPPRCDACGAVGRRLMTPAWPEEAPLNSAGRGKLAGKGGGLNLCRECAESWQTVGRPQCRCCGVPLVVPAKGDHRCGDCLQHDRRFGKARSALVYQGAVRRLVHRFKYDHQTWMAGPFAGLLCGVLQELTAVEPVDVLVPVPLHRHRRRQRGFNQADLLARRMKAHLPEAIELVAEALSRPVATAPQAGLGRRLRRRNVTAAFIVKDPARIRSRHILLIDDVYTTGATADACAEALIRAGAAGVNVLTLARVPGGAKR